LPYVVVDGVKPMAGTYNLKDRFVKAIAERSNQNAVATLDFLDLLDKKQESKALAGRVQINALQNVSDGEIFLHVALVENDIFFSVAPGTNGQKQFFDIMRTLLPVTGGEPVSLAAGQSDYFDFRFEIKPEWGRDLEVVAFLQDQETGQVLQSISTVSFR